MKYISFFALLVLISININKSYADESLTTKQQLDRIIEEIKDLNKAVFNKSFDKDQLHSIENNIDTERFTSIDIRIYDLQNDIKNLTLQFEEILFRLDDFSDDIKRLESTYNNKFKKILNESKQNNVENIKIDNSKQLLDEEENSLGKIIISEGKNSTKEIDLSTLTNNLETKEKENVIDNLSPEEILQSGIDQLRKKNYKKSKQILENFILNFPKNNLSGSAHYWLGKIYLFEKNYRNAALVFGEGVQQFPKSIKAAEMYYELVRSLKEMDKTLEACKTISLLEKNYKNSKFSKDPEKIKEQLDCQIDN